MKNMHVLDIRHFNDTLNGTGGVQKILKIHLKKEKHYFLKTKIVLFDEKNQISTKRILNLKTLCPATRWAQRQIIKKLPKCDCSVWHKIYFIDTFFDVDFCTKRILFLHNMDPCLDEEFKKKARYFHHVFCVSQEIYEHCKKINVNGKKPTISQIFYPIERASYDRVMNFQKRKTIGFCSRLIDEQKKVSRLPSFIKTTNKVYPSYSIEIVGDGPYREKLKKEIENMPNAKMYGFCKEKKVKKMMKRWSLIFFTSDYEGTPLALLEALSLGVVPIYPKINCGGTRLISAINKHLLYRHNSPQSLRRALQSAIVQSQSNYHSFIKKCQRVLSRHSLKNYFYAYIQIIRANNKFFPVFESERKFNFKDYIPIYFFRQFNEIRNQIVKKNI